MRRTGTLRRLRSAGGAGRGGGVAGGVAVGRGPSIRVTVPISALLGDQSVAAMLEGYGAISAADARRIAADPRSTWRRLLTDPASGRGLEFGRRAYRPRAESEPPPRGGIGEQSPP